MWVGHRPLNQAFPHSLTPGWGVPKDSGLGDLLEVLGQSFFTLAF